MTTGRHDNKEDRELLQLFYADGNNAWLGILLQRYTAMLLGVSMKYLKNEEDAKDNVQQVFVKVIGELQKYRVDYFKSWLYMVAKNHCLMRLRDKNKSPQALKEDILFSEDDFPSERSPAEKEMLLTRLEEAIRLLNPEQQACITLFYLQKKTYSEIAAIMSFPLMQVKSNIQNGKRKLKIHMEKIFPYEH